MQFKSFTAFIQPVAERPALISYIVKSDVFRVMLAVGN